MQRIKHKISRVSNATCKDCPQLWEEECRALCAPHSEAEKLHRQGKLLEMNCRKKKEEPNERDR